MSGSTPRSASRGQTVVEVDDVLVQLRDVLVDGGWGWRRRERPWRAGVPRRCPPPLTWRRGIWSGGARCVPLYGSGSRSPNTATVGLKMAAEPTRIKYPEMAHVVRRVFAARR